MKLGLLYEVQIPKPWTPGIEARTYGEVIEQVVLADQLGWGHDVGGRASSAPAMSHCPAPEVLFGALTQRTSRIRIGHGIALLPRNFNHALRIAERAAVLDILSGGRVDLGTGRAVTLQELDGFDVNPDDTQAMWAEAIEILVRSWKDEPVQFAGKFYNIPSSYVVPKPIQKPHPPLWLAGTNPATFSLAGQKGLGMLGCDRHSGRIGAANRRVQRSGQACRAGGRIRQRSVRSADPDLLRRDTQAGHRRRYAPTSDCSPACRRTLSALGRKRTRAQT